MKKLSLILSLLLTVVLFTGCRETMATEANKETHTRQSVTITKEQAEDFALNHAGFSRDAVMRLHTEFDRDHIDHYDVEFEKDGYEYEYEVHAETGEILDFHKDYDD